MRAKDELYPGNASPTVGPHGATIDPVTHKATNPPYFGYDAPLIFLFTCENETPDGRAMACKGQLNVANPSLTPAR